MMFDTKSVTIAGDPALLNKDDGEGYVLKSDYVYGQRAARHWCEDGLCVENFWDSLDPNNVWGSLTPEQREEIMGEASVYCQWEMMQVFHFRNRLLNLALTLGAFLLAILLIAIIVFA